MTGKFKIDRVVAAIDCGQIVNPESVRAQAESAIIYGLSAALKNEITIKDGAVEQTNFDGYDPIRIDEAPPIEVHLVINREDPGGMGEPGLPPAAPAVANAYLCGLRPAVAQASVSAEARVVDGARYYFAATEVAGSNSSFSQ